jgi:hypothetical protein
LISVLILDNFFFFLWFIIEALAQACSESILNPEYLLGSGEPFTAVSTASVVTTSSDTRVDLQEFLSTKSNGSPFMGMSVDSMLKAESPSQQMLYWLL